jgi:hypothetical protein
MIDGSLSLSLSLFVLFSSSSVRFSRVSVYRWQRISLNVASSNAIDRKNKRRQEDEEK